MEAPTGLAPAERNIKNKPKESKPDELGASTIHNADFGLRGTTVRCGALAPQGAKRNIRTGSDDVANVFVDDTSLQAIAGAIREKTGGTATMKPGDMAGAIRGIESGGMEINGKIQTGQVAANATIAAGDFVENEGYAADLSSFSGVQSITMGSAYEESFHAISMEDGRVLLLFCSADNSNRLTACIAGPADRYAQFIVTGFGEQCVSVGAVALGGNRVLAVFGRDEILYGSVLSVFSNGSVFPGPRATLNAGGGIYRPALTVCADGTVLLCARSEKDSETGNKREGRMWVARLCISGDEITTVGSGWFTSASDDAPWQSTDTMLQTPAKIFSLSNDRAVIFYEGSDFYHYGTVLTISESGVTDKTPNAIIKGASEQMFGALRKNEDDFYFWYRTNTSVYIREMTISESGAMTQRTSKRISLTGASSIEYCTDAVILPDGNLAVIYDNTSWKATVAEIEAETGTVKWKEETEAYLMQPPRLIVAANGRLMAFCFQDVTNCAASFFFSDNAVVLGPYHTNVFGVAKTGGSAGETIEVYTPE